MKKVLKTIIILIIMLAILIGVSACGNKSSNEKNSKEGIETNSPEGLVKDFIAKISDGKFDIASKYVDWAKYYNFDTSAKPDYSEIKNKDWKEYEESTGMIDYYEEQFKIFESAIDKAEKVSIKATDIKVEKLEEYDVDDLYEVTFNVEGEYKKDKDSEVKNIDNTITFVVVKENGDYLIVDGISDFQYGVLVNIYYNW